MLFEMSVRSYHYSLRNISEERSSYTDNFFRIKGALIIVPSDIPISRCVSRTNDVNTSGFVVRNDQSRVQHTHRLHRSCVGLPKTLRQDTEILANVLYECETRSFPRRERTYVNGIWV